MATKKGAGGKPQEFDAKTGRYGSGQSNTKLNGVRYENSATEKPKRKKSQIVKLDKKEYASVCSAIKTRYGNQIPYKGDLLYGNNYYRYTYNKKEERIICTLRLPIQGNEEQIMKLRSRKRYGI